MDALRIAFDTIIVGALALPWVLLVTDLFFLENPEDDNLFKKAWIWATKKKEVPSAVAGVTLFAVTYFLGSAITRTAQDFFNDDDLVSLVRLDGRWPTEDIIRTAEYCGQAPEIRSTFKEISPWHSCKCPKAATENLTWRSCNYWLGRWCGKYPEDLVRETQQVFRLQESALLLNGEDKTARLRQLHDQTEVLRGAAFDGILALVFCSFCWCARVMRQEKEREKKERQGNEKQEGQARQGKRVRWRLGLWLVPFLFLVPALYSLKGHFQASGIDEAPFMEVTFILLGAAALRGPHNGESRRWYEHGLFLVLLLFLGVACLAWWRTEALYSRQVIDSFYAQRHAWVK